MTITFSEEELKEIILGHMSDYLPLLYDQINKDSLVFDVNGGEYSLTAELFDDN